jgi:tetraacyldisaccharide 4'-kinase
VTVKTPAFWYEKRCLKAYTLLPLAWLYQAGHRVYQAISTNSYKSKLPVICIGNATAGGSGKTPVVLALLPLIRGHGLAKNPAVLTRGYGTKNTAPLWLAQNTAPDENLPDEAILLSRHANVVIATDRAAGARLAEENGADLILMDDGFFNRKLEKDLRLLVVDRMMDFGNGFTLPAGPLREPLSRILPKTDAVVTIGPAFHSDLPVFEAGRDVPEKPDANARYIGFAGIGYPQKFRATLEQLGLSLAAWHEFPDHHRYTNAELENLQEQARQENAVLITTEKDAVKIPGEMLKNMAVLKIILKFKEEAALATFLKDRLPQ